jgi:hypothetical protein
MALFSNRKEHFRQYAKVAGKGNVEVAWTAWTPLTDKLHLKCRVCEEALTATEPEDETAIDHSVQEWIRMHAHHISADAKKNIGYSPDWGSSPLLNELQIKKQMLQAELIALESKVEEAKPKPVSALQTKTGRKFR